jgi:CubicO group peptidase (beta-lactamase class C family)
MIKSLRNLRAVVAVALLAFSITSAAAAPNDYDSVLKYYASAKNFHGAIGVASNGKIEFLGASGQGNRQAGTSLNIKSKFKIASVTKTFTAVMILQLVQEGKLDLKSTIGTYMPSYRGEGRDKVTLDHLLTYSAGISNCEGSTGLAVYQRKMTVDEFIVANASGKLEFTPGSKFNYDNGGYIILGRIIELVTGKSFAVNLQTRILQPLAMANTSMLASQDLIPGLAPTYNIDDKTGAFLVDDPMYIENYFAAGAMYSTVEDLLLFDQGLFGGKLLRPAMLQVMMTPRPSLYNVAIGFWVTDTRIGARTYKQAMRQGAIWGANADWIHLLDANKSIVVLSNTNATDLPDLVNQLALVATDQKATIKVPTPAMPTQTASASRHLLVGTWQLDLRPDPTSEPYIKDFLVLPTTSKDFSGEFYGSKFSGGRLNNDWDKLYLPLRRETRPSLIFILAMLMETRSRESRTRRSVNSRPTGRAFESNTTLLVLAAVLCSVLHRLHLECRWWPTPRWQPGGHRSRIAIKDPS